MHVCYFYDVCLIMMCVRHVFITFYDRLIEFMIIDTTGVLLIKNILSHYVRYASSCKM